MVQCFLGCYIEAACNPEQVLIRGAPFSTPQAMTNIVADREDQETMKTDSSRNLEPMLGHLKRIALAAIVYGTLTFSLEIVRIGQLFITYSDLLSYAVIYMVVLGLYFIVSFPFVTGLLLTTLSHRARVQYAHLCTLGTQLLFLMIFCVFLARHGSYTIYQIAQATNLYRAENIPLDYLVFIKEGVPLFAMVVTTWHFFFRQGFGQRFLAKTTSFLTVLSAILFVSSGVLITHRAVVYKTSPETLYTEIQPQVFEDGTQERRDVVLITFDALARDHMSIYGYFRNTTPKLRSRETELMIFEGLRAVASSTPVVMTSLLTGTSPLTHGVTSFRHLAPEALIRRSLPAIFKKAGYETHAVTYDPAQVHRRLSVLRPCLGIGGTLMTSGYTSTKRFLVIGSTITTLGGLSSSSTSQN